MDVTKIDIIFTKWKLSKKFKLKVVLLRVVQKLFLQEVGR